VSSTPVPVQKAVDGGILTYTSLGPTRLPSVATLTSAVQYTTPVVPVDPVTQLPVGTPSPKIVYDAFGSHAVFDGELPPTPNPGVMTYDAFGPHVEPPGETPPPPSIDPFSSW
jgi:hypothetical protein